MSDIFVFLPSKIFNTNINKLWQQESDYREEVKRTNLFITL